MGLPVVGHLSCFRGWGTPSLGRPDLESHGCELEPPLDCDHREGGPASKHREWGLTVDNLATS